MEKENNSKYLKFIDTASELCKDIPRHFSRYSNKIFCNHQKIILLVLKQKLRTTYRDLIEILKISTIPMHIGLKRIPHHTTLVKFAKKIKPCLLNLLLPYRKARITSIDGTGFEVENRSMHYQLRTTRSTYRQYIKLGISADTDRQIIMKQATYKGPRNDNKDFMPLVKGIKTSFVCADKGYDANKHHEYVYKYLKARSFIKVRNHGMKNLIVRSKQKYRKRARREFDEKIYHQRSKVESIFSSIKRKYGSCLKARNFSTQKKEVICKLIAYNLDRIIIFY
ncbi:MAG TPA: IS5 family transposase [Candidatus Nanoarchaeia archaeon]|nr:IS5 family transposase [Candidatus Nanoarchaeia archaeon]